MTFIREKFEAKYPVPEMLEYRPGEDAYELVTGWRGDEDQRSHYNALYEGWQAAHAQVESETAPDATLLAPDPYDESCALGQVWLSQEDWKKLGALPAGTRLYAKQPVPHREIPECFSETVLWLRQALNCPYWNWDPQQRDCAEEACSEAESLLSTVKN